jgi:hypothetical protein
VTKRFEYTDIDGIIKEAEAYIASEYISTTPTINSPVLTDGTGKINSALLPPIMAGESASLVITRVAGEVITLGDCVSASSVAGEVILSTYNTTENKAKVLGVALESKAANQNIRVLVLGIITDSIFNVFSPNDILFLDEDGAITDIRPTTNNLTIVGKALGLGEVLVNPTLPVRLT